MDGLIVIYKEKGYTSFDVVAKLRGILGQKKIGHTGTLDPDAQGVLPVCVGNATKLCELFTEKDKIYEAVLHLGITTDTQDMTGSVLSQTAPTIQAEALEKIIQGFVGKQEQIPPMYSALKVGGQKLCDLARKGIEVERRPREIEIFSIDHVRIEMPKVFLRVHCSKGTYIRTLCHDIGMKAGCGGCMESLLRVETAGFMLEEAHRLDEVEAIVKGCNEGTRLEDILYPVDQILNIYPPLKVAPSADRLLKNGNRIDKKSVQKMECGMAQENNICADSYREEQYRMYSSAHKFMGIYRYDESGGVFKPVKMFL